MNKSYYVRGLIVIFSMILLFFFQNPILTFASTEQKVYDHAQLLTERERAEIESLADDYSKQNQIDIVIVTTSDTEGKNVVKYMQDFYDEKGFGYDKPFGDTVILTIDMQNREVYVAGFYKGMEYIDDQRANSIREKITPDLSAGRYYDAFSYYIELTDRYMGIEPGVNPDNLFYQLWFQVAVSLIVASISVGIMAYRSTGRKTTNARTYIDDEHSIVTKRSDMFVRTVVTKTKKPSNNKGGGGGITGGGHSHSGSRGRF